MRMSTAGGILFICGAAIAGCGDGGGSIPDSVSIEELPAALEQATCEWYVRCGLRPDMETCTRSFFPERFEHAKTLEALAAAGTVVYDPDAAGTCLQARADRNCNLAGLLFTPPECSDVFTGTIAEGGACIASEECADGGVCERESCPEACCAGVCADRPERPQIPIGQSCANFEDGDCVDGSYCRNADEICVARVGEGGDCGQLAACDTGLFCAGLDGGTGTCRDVPAAGQSCAAVDFCEELRLFCDPADLVCKEKLGPGESCTEEDNSCRFYLTCHLGECTEIPSSVGASCAELDDCLGDLECTGSSCAAPPDEPACDPL